MSKSEDNYHHGGGNLPEHNEGETQELSVKHEVIDAYWKTNIRLLVILLTVWVIVSFGCSILFVDALNQINFFGFPLGFWFAQQGSILCFVILIFVYSKLIGRIEDRFHLDDKDHEKKGGEQ